jgi:predicted DCC family thiol-disulfide oxidoreductase YuxK
VWPSKPRRWLKFTPWHDFSFVPDIAWPRTARKRRKRVTEGTTLTLLYDGDCPICNRYVTLLQLRENFGTLTLLDARQASPQRSRVEQLGLDLNQGFALFVEGELYFGDRAIQALALMSGKSGLFSKVHHYVFRHAMLARLLYPALVAGRRVLLALLRRRPIE